MAPSADRRASVGAYLGLAGPIAVLLYLIHVIWGGLTWPGYDPMTQTISELTGSTSPNAGPLTVLTTAYGIGMVVAAVGIMLAMRQVGAPVTARIGSILLLVMTAASLIGYALFPLDPAGAVDSFQNLGHYVVTGVVVLCTLGSVWLVGIGLIRTSTHRALGAFSLVCASVITVFGGITPAAIAQGWPISGLTERINIFTLLAWVCVLAVYLYRRDGGLAGTEHQPAV